MSMLDLHWLPQHRFALKKTHRQAGVTRIIKKNVGKPVTDMHQNDDSVRCERQIETVLYCIARGVGAQVCDVESGISALPFFERTFGRHGLRSITR